jgi:hypothetical protein
MLRGVDEVNSDFIAALLLVWRGTQGWIHSRRRRGYPERTLAEWHMPKKQTLKFATLFPNQDNPYNNIFDQKRQANSVKKKHYWTPKAPQGMIFLLKDLVKVVIADV